MGAFDLIETMTLSAGERAAIVADATHSADFLICGNRIRILGNTPLPAEKYLRYYRAFAAERADQAADLAVYCRLSDSASGRAVTFLAGDEAYRITDPDVIDHLDTTLDYLIFPRIRSHYLVHAGCVSRGGQGMILSGSSGMGKTTLTTYLVSRGMGYLSDEIAPIHRKDCTVEPFPLRLGVRPGPARKLVEGLPGDDFSYGTDEKRLVDVRDLGGPPVRGPVPLHAVVFLAQRATKEVSTPLKFAGEVRVSFLGVTPEFRTELLEKTGTTLVREEKLSPKVVAWRLRVADSSSFLPTLYAVAGKHGLPVAGVEYEDIDRHDFSVSPHLVELPKSSGVMELIKKMSSFQKQRIMDADFNGKMPPFVQGITQLTRGVAFYKLSPGRLDEMLSALEGLP
ncbi:MAG: hypothetical protein V1873_04040 [Verrucomicrobiota bacterium]